MIALDDCGGNENEEAGSSGEGTYSDVHQPFHD